MHYSDIRDRVWAAADYAPAGSPEGIARTREFINRALNRIALDAPFLFERDINIYLDPDVLPNDKAAVADTWRSVPGGNFDPWVIESTWTLASAAALYNRFVNPERPFSGWYFECKDPADPTGERILSFRIREVWTIDEGITRRVRISFFEPTPYDTPGFAPTAGGGVGVITDWRITVKQYALPPEVVEIQTIRPYDTTNDYGYFRYITAEDACRDGYEGSYWTKTATSLPLTFWPGEVETLANTSVAPVISATGTWSAIATAEPKGQFEYVYTLSLGERHDEVQDINPMSSTSAVANSSGRRMPYIESPPSPIAGPNDDTTKQIIIRTPNIPLLVGFEAAARARYRKVGVKANIYRRRITVDSSYTLPYPTSNHFQHLATVAFTLNGYAEFTDDGTSVPGRRLRRVGGYKTLRFSNCPDKRYQVRVRCLVRPYEMLDDSDACEVPPSAIDALIFLSLRNLYEASGNPSMAASSFMDYERALHALKKRHASLKPPGETWKMRSRSCRRRRGYRHYHNVSDS